MIGSGVPTVLVILALAVVLIGFPGWVAVVLVLAALLLALRDGAELGGGWDWDEEWDDSDDDQYR